MASRVLKDQPASDFEGVAIMLVPQDEDAATVAPFAAVQQEHLHTTLAFLGDAKELRERGINCDTIVSALLRTAYNTGPVKATLGGITRFDVPGDAPDPLVLNVSSRGIEPLREEVLSTLSLFGIEEDTEHGYTPHMTLGYLPKQNNIPMKRWESLDIFFDRIRVGFGGEEVDLPLDTFGGPIKVKAAPEGDGIPAMPGEDDRSEVDECTCCGGLGEHQDGHECYVCDASGTAEAQKGEVCEGHHGRPDDGPENAKERYGADFVHKDYDCTELVELAQEQKGVRRVRTPEGAATYGQPIGSIITRDVVPEADLRAPKTLPVLAKDLKEGDHVMFDEEPHEVTDVIPVDGELSIGLKSDRTGEEKAKRFKKTHIFAKIILGAAATVLAAMAAMNGGQSMGDDLNDSDVRPTSAPVSQVDAKHKPAPKTVKGYAKMFAQVPEAEWGGGDVSISHELPDGRRVWLYGDTLSENNGFVHSTAIVQDGGTLHVSKGGKQVIPNGGEDPNDSDRELIYWIDNVKQGPTDDTLRVSTMQMSIGTDNAWDFQKTREGMSREAIVKVDAKDNLTFQRWTKWTKTPVAGNPHVMDDIQIAGPNHYTYGTVTHDIKLADGSYLTTTSQNWDDGFENHTNPDGTFRYRDWAPTFSSTFATKQGEAVEKKAVPLKCGGCKRTFFTDDMTDWACPNCGHKGSKDVFGGLSGGGLGYGRLSQHEPPVTRPHRKKLRKRIAALVPNHTRNVQIKSAKDGDGDGWINDGKPNMMPAPTVTASLGDLKMVGPSEYGKQYGIVGDKHGDEYIVGPDMEDPGFFAAGLDENDELNWDDLAVESAKDLDEALSLLDARTRQPRKAGADPVRGSLSDTPTKINLPKRSTAARAADAQATRSAQAAAKAARSKKVSAPAKKASAAKKATSVATRAKKAATTAKKSTRAKKTGAKVSIPKILSSSGGDMTPEQKAGKMRNAHLSADAPTVKMRGKAATKAKRVKRDDPKDYLMRGSKPVQTEELRREAHLRLGGAPRALELADEKGKPFRLAPARDNEHLWFPKDKKGPVAYSFRQANPKLDKDGKQMRGKDGEPLFDGTYGPRVAVYTKEFLDNNNASKFDRVLALAPFMHKLDADIMKNSKKKDSNGQVAAAVLLMRSLGIRPNSEDEATQAKNKDKKSKLKAQGLRARGVDPDQPIFGAVTLRAKHVKVEGDTVTLDFIGKEHVRNTHVITDPLIATTLKAHVRGKTGDDELFPDIDSLTTQTYIKRHLGAGASNKDMRTFAATQMASELIMEHPAPKTEDELALYQAQIAQTVSLTLNNAAKQALGSYIAPQVWDKWKEGVQG